LVVPVTTMVRGVENEVPLGPGDGVLRPCVADAGSIRLLPKSALTKQVAALSRRQREKLDAALRFSLGLDG
jgi:mRNA-degrading endonuclease toxin of MazEF toxin-antitoxin module